MLKGKCPRCNSRSVFKKVNGVFSGEKHIYVRGVGGFSTPRSERITYVCTTCGYYENYIPDKSILKKVAAKWERVS